MDLGSAMPLLVVLTSLATGLLIFLAGERRATLRTVLNLGGALMKLGLIALMLDAVRRGVELEFRLPILPDLDLVLRADALTMLFSTLSSVLWLVTTVYAIGYLERSPHRARFFGFFSLCIAATMGVAAAGNLFTFFIFYELLTLATWPLIVHRGSRAAIEGGRSYLGYTLGGSALLLVGLIWLYGAAGSHDFIAHGSLTELGAARDMELRLIFLLLMAGFGVKAALVPLHGWLPTAMVAPAPVSALLHAVAVVKAGAFGLVRLVHDVYGFELTQQLGMSSVLTVAAAVTIVYGSLRALFQQDLKRRLAYSTVSQVSFIALGVSIGGPIAAVGGLVHLVHQGLMKITLFFCAGNYAETLGLHRVQDLDGTGRRMPWTSVCFTLGALGMMGMPPMAGFISKWFLGTGAVAAGQPWVVGVLVASTLLNAGYMLPMLHRIWFRPPPERWPEEQRLSRGVRIALIAPTAFAAFAALGVGLLAALPMSPLGWVTLIVDRIYP
jgi:multicomponent Na+:H+ antiporter subunit D